MALSGKKRKRSIPFQDNDDEQPSTKRQRMDTNPKTNQFENENNKNNCQTPTNSSQEILSQPLTQSQPEDIEIQPCTQISPTKTVPIEDESTDESDNDINIEYIDDHVWCLLVPINDTFEPIQIKKSEFTIGRHPNNDLMLDNKNLQSAVSSHHVILKKNDNILKDISKNGTYITEPYSHKKMVKKK
eukprot:82179_1